MKILNINENSIFYKIQLSDLILIIFLLFIIFFELKNKFIISIEFIDKKLKFFIFFLIILSISSIYNFNDPFNSIIKFLLLFFYYVFTCYYLRTSIKIKKDIVIFLKFILYLNLVCIIFMLSSLFDIFNFSYLIKMYKNFLIFDEFLRLIGPHKPTSKLFATYLFFSSIILILCKDEISQQFFVFSIIAIFICSVFTLSRPGICTIFFILMYLLRIMTINIYVLLFFYFQFS